MLLKKLMLPFLFAVFATPTASAQSETIADAAADGRVVLVTDFDSTLTGPAWKSFWILKKIPFLSTFLENLVPLQNLQGQSFDDMPAEVRVTEREFYETVEKSIAKVEGRDQFTTRDLNPITLPGDSPRYRSEPVTFIPGYYYVDQGSFYFYRSNPKENFLVTDNSEAAQTERDTGLSRFGQAFPLFQFLSSNPAWLSNIFVVTARGQSSADFVDGLFTAWKKEGLIKYVKGTVRRTRNGPEAETARIFPLGRGESILYGNRLIQKKIQLVRDQIVADRRLVAKQSGKKFWIIVPDDRPEIAQEYFRLFSKLSAIGEYRQYLNFVFVHTGAAEDIRDSQLPARVTLFDNGFAVAAPDDVVKFVDTPEAVATGASEIKPENQNVEVRGSLSCTQIFSLGAL